MARLLPEFWQAIRTVWESDPDEPTFNLAALRASEKYKVVPPSKSTIDSRAKKEGWERRGTMNGIVAAAQRKADKLTTSDGSSRVSDAGGGKISDASEAAKDHVARVESEDMRAEVIARHRTEWKQVRARAWKALRYGQSNGSIFQKGILMGIQHEQIAPASFSEAFAENYLGSPQVVAGLVSRFCSQAEADFANLRAGALAKQAFTDGLNARVRAYADIFSGRDPAYKTVMGYHEHTLGFRLMADLGEFWQKQRGQWGDDPVCVLFEWLAVILADKVKMADGNDMLLGVAFGPTLQYAIGVLSGNGKRAAA